MNSIQYLSHKDFVIKEGKQGKNLCINLQGFVFVLYHGDGCGLCRNFIPEYRQISLKFPHFQFTMLNLTKYSNVAIAANNTSTPFYGVPKVYLYYKGKPIFEYRGRPIGSEFEKTIRLLITTYPNVTSSSFVHQKVNVDNIELQTSENGLIPFNIVCDDNMCYLTYREITDKKLCNEPDGCKECSVERTL